jgi:hypothetical protein
MHFKHQKLTDLCKELNEESAVRKHEAETLRQELVTVKSERDGLALESMRLRSAAEAHEKERTEFTELTARYLAYEQRGLGQAVQEIGARDQMIEDLTTKLSRALDQIEQYELERRQQRQQRQIILPK